MDRRQLVAGLAASAIGAHLLNAESTTTSYFLQLQTWRLHNTAEKQSARVSDFLENGLTPALSRAGAKLIGALGNLIGPDGPYYLTLTQFDSLAQMQDALSHLDRDETYQRATNDLASGTGLPFVRVESSLLRSFGPSQPAAGDAEHRASSRVFELRTYESQSFATLRRKIGMFNGGEIGIFQRLGMRPVFFGETIVGPRQPNIVYMLSFDSLNAREELWRKFGSDPEWKTMSAKPELSDAEIVMNISNVMLRALPFSTIR